MKTSSTPLSPQEAAILLARKKLLEFSIVTNRKYQPSYHHRIIADTLEKVEKGEIKRLMIFLPPRHGKSQLASINFPAWYLGKNPDKKIICASYSGELAQDFGGKTRDLVHEGIYRAIFPLELKEDSQSKAKWDTKEGGYYVSVGIGGAITGRGADVLLIDDPLKNREEAESAIVRQKAWDWFTSTAYTRLEPNGAIVLIMTRWHYGDLAGRLLEQNLANAREKSREETLKLDCATLEKPIDQEAIAGEEGGKILTEGGVGKDPEVLRSPTPQSATTKSLKSLSSSESPLASIFSPEALQVSIDSLESHNDRLSSKTSDNPIVEENSSSSKKNFSSIKKKKISSFKSGRDLSTTPASSSEDSETSSSLSLTLPPPFPPTPSSFSSSPQEGKILENNVKKDFSGVVEEEYISQSVIDSAVDSKIVHSIVDKDGDEWHVLKFPAVAMEEEYDPAPPYGKLRNVGEALWPNRYSLRTLGKIKETIGLRDWASLYQQEPIIVENQEFLESDLQFFEEEEVMGKNLKFSITVDLAISKRESADRTAIVVVGKEPSKPNWYVMETVAKRLDPLETIDTIFALHHYYRMRGPVIVGIESVAYQKSMLYFLQEEMRKRQSYLHLIELRAKSKKEERIRGLVPLFKTGVVRMRKNQTELRDELMLFPSGAHDDLIDALAFQLQLVDLTTLRRRHAQVEDRQRSSITGW